ncbi:unnamed protein product [Dibothriocephalus latus]|uniref:Uncharacterized protein n=1 Tax=Dibothriocephalus latus TaxID=60516 RepID=A0A3P7NU11_DIBLA|nr:unnamed protein product [Dibothriocephalus latus]
MVALWSVAPRPDRKASPRCKPLTCYPWLPSDWPTPASPQPP